jgi:hypothetical protein
MSGDCESVAAPTAPTVVLYSKRMPRSYSPKVPVGASTANVVFRLSLTRRSTNAKYRCRYSMEQSRCSRSTPWPRLRDDCKSIWPLDDWMFRPLSVTCMSGVPAAEPSKGLLRDPRMNAILPAASASLSRTRCVVSVPPLVTSFWYDASAVALELAGRPVVGSESGHRREYGILMLEPELLRA